MISFGIRTRLTAAIAGIVILSGLIISQVVTHRYTHSLLQTAKAQSENLAHNLALDAADKLLVNDIVGLRKLLDDRMKANSELAFLFILEGEKVVSHTFESGVPVGLIAANRPMGDRQGSIEKIVSEKGERYLDVAWPIFGGRAGVLRAGFFEKAYLKDASDLRLQISLLTAAVLLFSLAAGHLFVRHITRQLVRLTEAVEHIDEAHMDLSVTIESRDEVGKLSTAFHKMLDRIKDFTGRLKNTAEQLEQTNRELERAYRQAKIAFEIAREMGSISDIRKICRFLLERLKTIITCRQIVLVLFENDGTQAAVYSAEEVQALRMTKKSIDELAAAFTASRFIAKGKLPISVPEFQKAETIAAFPIRHEERMIGAMCVGCPGECACVRNEMDVIELVLAQSAGAIRRAAVHENEVRGLRLRIEQASGYSGFVGKDPKMQVVYKLIEDVAPSDATVLILGESGTGKELAARAIHQNSDRKENPFVVLNCSAYPSTLLESELFGYEKGAFTGASAQKPGRFELADGGTIFLDEIGEIPSTAQVKLLRVLQHRNFERIGGTRTLAVDVRVLAATNRDLLQDVKNGRFREDLYYRLNVIPIRIPPLRDRRNDVPMLARHFLDRFCTIQEKTIEDFSSSAMRLLLDYPWPGNVRELENTIEHAVVLARGSRIQPSDLPVQVLEPEPADPTESARPLQDTEKEILLEALAAANWNKAETARRLGIGRSTLYSKMKKYRIRPPESI